MATLELRWPNHRMGRPVVNQLLGHSNAAVDREVYLGVSDWLAQNQNLVCAPPVANFADNLDEARWRSFWKAYIAEKGERALVSERPDGFVLARLCRDVDVLSRCVQA